MIAPQKKYTTTLLHGYGHRYGYDGWFHKNWHICHIMPKLQQSAPSDNFGWLALFWSQNFKMCTFLSAGTNQSNKGTKCYAKSGNNATFCYKTSHFEEKLAGTTDVQI